MSYASVDMVRKHIQTPGAFASSTCIRGEAVILNGTAASGLQHSGLIESSEKVKAIQQLYPIVETVVIADEVCNLANADIVPGSLVLASDSSLKEVYTENEDFLANFEKGDLVRIDGSKLEVGQSVNAWCYCYKVFKKESDYTISYTDGKISRIDSGSIASGQQVLVDYDIEAGVFTDDVILAAISEADAQMMTAIDQSLIGNSVSVLAVAETYLAIAILVEIRALEVLQSPLHNSTSRSGIASQLLTMSTEYRQRYDSLILPYLKKASRLKSPIRS